MHVFPTGRIQLSSDTHALVMSSGTSSPGEWLPTGGVEVKGKGVMETYLWREGVLQEFTSRGSNRSRVETIGGGAPSEFAASSMTQSPCHSSALGGLMRVNPEWLRLCLDSVDNKHQGSPPEPIADALRAIPPTDGRWAHTMYPEPQNHVLLDTHGSDNFLAHSSFVNPALPSEASNAFGPFPSGPSARWILGNPSLTHDSGPDAGKSSNSSRIAHPLGGGGTPDSAVGITSLIRRPSPPGHAGPASVHYLARCVCLGYWFIL